MLILLAVLGCAGCAHGWRHHSAVPAAAAQGPAPLTVGTIALVDEGRNFVLIDNGNSPGFPAGLTVKSYSAGVESGELVTTEVRRHPFAIADIRSGDPRKGDTVKYLPVKGPVRPMPPVTAGAPRPTP